MIACVDVHYVDDFAVAACVLFREWTHGRCVDRLTARVEGVAPCEPGRFIKRELKPLLAVLGQVPVALRTVVVDGYVWLDAADTPGLGAHLYRALAEKVPVVGVAKHRFGDAGFAVRVLRGQSVRPLYVTAAGMSLRRAAGCILRMHGPDRLPTMIRMADRLSRTPCP